MAAYRSQASQTAIQKVADDLQAADPKLSRKDALFEASRISGYSFRDDSRSGLRQAELLSKLRQENPLYKTYELQLLQAKTPEQKAQIQGKLEEIEMRAYGKLVSPRAGGVGSGGWSAEQIGG